MIYAADARELLPGMAMIVGRDSMRAFYRNLIEQSPRIAHEFAPNETVVAESGDLAVVHGSYPFTPDTLRAEETRTGKFVGVWRSRSGDWRLQINISNAGGPEGTSQAHRRSIVAHEANAETLSCICELLHFGCWTGGNRLRRSQ